MNQGRKKKSGSPPVFWKFIGLSVTLHMLLIAGVLLGPTISRPLVIKDQPIQTHLVKFKEKKPDPKRLPKKKKAVAKKTEPKKIKPAPKNKTSTRPKQKPVPKISIEDRLSSLTKGFQELEHVDLQARDELTAQMALTYEQQIQAIIKESYTIPATLPKDRLAALEVSILLKIGAAGGPIGVSILKSSGNSTYDRAVVQGASGVTTFGAPPIGLQAKYARTGVKIVLCPLSCEEK